ncbi:MAG: bifunctional (p)ppGpp synthetase/guanosine-3',5'-bis(diphosphate) 3'-pyrophosphohydrolase [Pseudomonadales bacterium]|nr:bifunctional (p)ppGpp synthetase/guanosine-3',5'-bis(diphosphate) 3'-pyrophosphohydrolase [Pseudomonadales bacterium]
MQPLDVTPPEMLEVIERTAAALQSHGVDSGALAQGREIAAIVAELTRDAPLVAAVLAREALPASALAGPATAQLIDDNAVALARELHQFGNLASTDDTRANRRLQPAQAEALRKMLLSVVSDPRLVIARLARQLVQLRHARLLEAAPRRALAAQTREIFAPLANRLGLWQLKWELEDLAFRHLDPDNYQFIAAALNEKRVDRERYIAELVIELTRMLAAAGIRADVYGRPKHIYSIWRKMQRKHLEFNQLYDIRAVRIVVPTIADCYSALGVVHGKFPYIRAEFDDYIATPKDNDYRSIHTAVIGPHAQTIEVQIRTTEMHEQSELGVAAHWRYKEGTQRNLSYDRKIEWIRRLLEPTSGASADGDFLEEVRGELFEDRVYALTPKGEVVDLPQGATPLDFAYYVHTDLGHRCRGARVNGRIVPLSHQLANGEVVEILTHKLASPSRDWLSAGQRLLISPRSRSKVRAWFRKLDEGSAPSERAPEPGKPGSGSTQQSLVPRVRPKPPSRRAMSPVTVAGVDDLPTNLARCCAPVRPQPIVGYITVGRGVTVHRSDCPGLLRMVAQRPERALSAAWSDESSALPVGLLVLATDRRGLVRDVSEVLASLHLGIDSMHTSTDSTKGIARLDIGVAVRDLTELEQVLSRLRTVSSVLSAKRLR